MPRFLFMLIALAHAFGAFAWPFSGATDTVHKTPGNKVEEFFYSRSLPIDSAADPYLYYKVYEWIGTKYKYAGETKKGIDCSGFVSEMYREVYCIMLSGGSRDIFPVTTPVEKSELKEGDLLFFRIKKGQISHVGIYLGNNKFAHASVKSGVIISDLDEEYYKRYFYKGGRIIAAPN
jgi:murein DD-endopeptidase / murein LD-carboxypeptidase